MGILSSLSRSQKEAIGLLQIGTFLEYFDLMLYVHMAVLLNELFFPKSDPHTAALVTAFAFCSTYVLRPFGALIFGYIGDHIGRKTTVIMTTMMMSISCVVMANLPTYAQIGIAATWVITICRIVQGLSSMGEFMGASVYVTEITKPPAQYMAVSLISIASAVGALFALGLATLVTTSGFNWRIAFWVGATIAMVGTLARTRLRETPEFIEARLKLLKRINKKIEGHEDRDSEKINRKTLLSCFAIYCGWPVTFYLTFMYFNFLLKRDFGYSAENIIFHNFLLSMVVLPVQMFMSFLSLRVYPLKIMRIRGVMCLIYMLILPFMIPHIMHPIQLFLMQCLLIATHLGDVPGGAIFIKHFPVFKRFTATSFLYAVSRALIYIITSFGLVYLTEWFAYFGIWAVGIPATISFLWGIRHFEALESESRKITETEVENI